MNENVKFKLHKIADLWNYFILEYRYCSRKIKFNDDVKTNYLNDILEYFNDTLDIVFKAKTESDDYSEKFSHTICFLQTIYMQQDFVEEMLDIFKTTINKGQLKNDQLYSINRGLRNELIGHPIRKDRKKGNALTSSTLFCYNLNKDEIQYLRYHRDNQFQPEKLTYSIIDIQQRHKEFLEKYLDVILSRLKLILDEFTSELERLEEVISKRDFATVLKLVELYLETIFNSDFIHDKESLLKIYSRKENHPRYHNFIDKFYRNLRDVITSKKKLVSEIFHREKTDFSQKKSLNFPKPELLLVDNSEIFISNDKQKFTYHYELAKLSTKRNFTDFDMFSELLKGKCRNNTLVLEELDHMKNNIDNEIEYYTALSLISDELLKKKSKYSP